MDLNSLSGGNIRVDCSVLKEGESMELVKNTPEEQAKIDADKKRPHVSMVVFCSLSTGNIFQDQVSEMLEAGMIRLKERADAAKMIILSTSISTNMVELAALPFLCVMILCQWAEIEKLEEQQRRAFLAGGGAPGRRGA
jgi:hypothetical protein